MIFVDTLPFKLRVSDRRVIEHKATYMYEYIQGLMGTGLKTNQLLFDFS